MILLTVVSILAVAILLHPRFRKWHKSNEPAFVFVVSLLATFCGVAWAISLGDHAQDRRDRVVATQLILNARQEAHLLARRIAMNAAYGEIMKGKRKYLPHHWQVRLPPSLETLRTSELALRHIQPATMSVINYNVSVFERCLADSSMDCLGQHMLVIMRALDFELLYLQGKMSRRVYMNRDSLYQATGTAAPDSLPETWNGLREKGLAWWSRWKKR